MPEYIFFAIQPADRLNGDFQQSSTMFELCGVNEVNLKVDGNSVHNHPIKIRGELPVIPYRLLLDNMQAWFATDAGQQVSLSHFRDYYVIYSHKFEAENTEDGWISIELNLDSAFDDAYNLIMWSVVKTKITIDRFRHIEKTLL